MKKAERVLAILLCAALLMMLPITANTGDGVSIVSAEILQGVDANGEENEEMISLTFSFTVPTGTEEIAILLSTEEIGDIDGESLSKVLYIDQIAVPESGAYTIAVSRASVEELLGTTEFDESSLHLKLSEATADAPTVTDVPFVAPEPEPLLGDVNDDGRITVGDALQLLRAILNNGTDQFDLRTADMNGDGSITLIDVLRILKVVAE